MRKVLPNLILLLFVNSCIDDKKKIIDETHKLQAYPGAYEVDFVDNIQSYFDSLYHECGADVWTHNPEIGESIEVWKAVNELHQYVNHQRKYYPVDDVFNAMKVMAFEQGYAYSHSGENPDSVNNGEIFLFRFIEQAVLHSPKLDFVTNFHAEDGNAGILYFPEWSSINPLYSFLVYRTNQGFNVLTIGEKGDTKINKIFQLLDKRGRIYYLCSNNDDAIYFRQYLYGWDGETMKLLCYTDSINEWKGYNDGYTIVFNPEELTWNYCFSHNGIYQEVVDATMYKLHLDWDKSKFEGIASNED